LCEENDGQRPDKGHDKASEQARNRYENAKRKVERHCKDKATLAQLALLGLLAAALALAPFTGGLSLAGAF